MLRDLPRAGGIAIARLAVAPLTRRMGINALYLANRKNPNPCLGARSTCICCADWGWRRGHRVPGSFVRLQPTLNTAERL